MGDEAGGDAGRRKVEGILKLGGGMGETGMG